MMDLASYPAIFYTDTIDVYRSTSQGNVRGYSLVLSDVKGHLSLNGKPQLAQGPQAAKIDSDFTVYCMPDIDIREGDRLQVTHKGQKAKYDVGTVHVYDLNRLCRCKKRGAVYE